MHFFEFTVCLMAKFDLLLLLWFITTPKILKFIDVYADELKDEARFLTVEIFC